MPNDRLQDILDNIHSRKKPDGKVQLLVYHVAVDGQKAFDELALRFEGRLAIDRTIVIVSGLDKAPKDERMYLFCHVSPDLEGTFNRHVIVEKLHGAYRKALADPAGGDAAARIFWPGFIELFEENNMVN